jgi:hypothetical protein
MSNSDLREREVTLLARIPRWLWDLLLAESKRRGTGYMRLTAAALEREIVHGGQPVEMLGTSETKGTQEGADKR